MEKLCFVSSFEAAGGEVHTLKGTHWAPLITNHFNAAADMSITAYQPHFMLTINHCVIASSSLITYLAQTSSMYMAISSVYLNGLHSHHWYAIHSMNKQLKKSTALMPCNPVNMDQNGPIPCGIYSTKISEQKGFLPTISMCL